MPSAPDVFTGVVAVLAFASRPKRLRNHVQ